MTDVHLTNDLIEMIAKLPLRTEADALPSYWIDGLALRLIQVSDKYDGIEHTTVGLALGTLWLRVEELEGRAA